MGDHKDAVVSKPLKNTFQFDKWLWQPLCSSRSKLSWICVSRFEAATQRHPIVDDHHQWAHYARQDNTLHDFGLRLSSLLTLCSMARILPVFQFFFSVTVCLKFLLLLRANSENDTKRERLLAMRFWLLDELIAVHHLLPQQLVTEHLFGPVEYKDD